MIDPFYTLGIDPDSATDQSVRQAYMKAVSLYPPDREPERFEEIRSAYEKINTEKKRLHFKLFLREDHEPLADDLSENHKLNRVPAEMWIAMITSETKRNF